MSGWLPKEILDHLTHAGYVAVPKECIEEFHTTQIVDQFELMCRSAEHMESIERGIVSGMARHMGHMLMEKGFIDVEVLRFDETRTFRHHGTIHVLKPRTIRKEA